MSIVIVHLSKGIYFDIIKQLYNCGFFAITIIIIIMYMQGNSMREYHVTKILFLIVSPWFFNILLSTSCALKKTLKIYI